MQSSRAMTEAEQGRGGRGGRGGGFGGGFGGRGGGGAPVTLQFPTPAANVVIATVPPGEYRVVLTVGGREYTQTAVVVSDRN